MVKLYDKGVYLINGTEIAESSEEVKAKTGGRGGETDNRLPHFKRT